MSSNSSDILSDINESRPEGYIKTQLENITKSTLFYLMIVLLVLWCSFPLIWAFIQSFINPATKKVIVEYIPSDPSLYNYQVVFEIFDFQRYITNSLILALGTTILCVIFSAFSSYVLAQFNFRFKNIYLLLILSMTMFPGIIIIAPLFREYLLINNLTRISLVNSNAFELVILGFLIVSLIMILFNLYQYYNSKDRLILDNIPRYVYVSIIAIFLLLTLVYRLIDLVTALLIGAAALILIGIYWLYKHMRNPYADLLGKGLIVTLIGVTVGAVVIYLLSLGQILTVEETPFLSLGLLIPYIAINMPLTVFLLYNFFQEIPRELILAARVDGASHFQVFSKIILPLAVPGIFTTAILVFIASWNEFLFASILIADKNLWTIPLALVLFTGIPPSGGIPFDQFLSLAAASVLVTIPLVVMVFIFQKQIISGITAGAIKG